MSPSDNAAPRAGFLRAVETWWPGIALILIIVFFALIRVRLLDFPLERDEGEYAYAGQLILRGIAPYQLCYTMKLPGTAAAYALAMAIFGETTEGVHLGLLLVNGATAVLVYALASRLMDRPAGVAASGCFALLSIEPSMLGFAGHATHFVLLPVLAGIILLLDGVSSGRRWYFPASGVLLGLGFLMKQPGIFFFLFALAYLLLCRYRGTLGWRGSAAAAAMLSLGWLLPFALTCFLMLNSGSFTPFWFWTFEYSSKYAAILTLADGVVLLCRNILFIGFAAPALWLMVAAGFIRLLTDRRLQDQAPFIIGFAAFSFAAICPGLYFRPHYFLLGLPAASLLCAAMVGARAPRAGAVSGRPRLLPALLFAAAFGLSLAQAREFLFRLPPVAASVKVYGTNPFAQLAAVAALVKQRTSPADRIAVIGSEPEIYFYTGRLSATGYMYMYPLMEPQPFASAMQHEMASQVEAAAPKIIVKVSEPKSWLERPDSDRYIFDWSADYLRSHYRQIDIAALGGPPADLLSESRIEDYRSGFQSISVYERVP